jgi:hypothetical protein
MADFHDENPGKRLRRRVFQAVKGDAEKKANDYLAFAMGFSTTNRGHDRINPGFRPVGSPFMAT